MSVNLKDYGIDVISLGSYRTEIDGRKISFYGEMNEVYINKATYEDGTGVLADDKITIVRKLWEYAVAYAEENHCRPEEQMLIWDKFGKNVIEFNDNMLPIVEICGNDIFAFAPKCTCSQICIRRSGSMPKAGFLKKSIKASGILKKTKNRTKSGNKVYECTLCHQKWELCHTKYIVGANEGWCKPISN